MFGIRELVDVALGALSEGTNDSTSAFETIKYLGGVVREVLLRDLPATTTTSDNGVIVVRGHELRAEEYVQRVRADPPSRRPGPSGGDRPDQHVGDAGPPPLGRGPPRSSAGGAGGGPLLLVSLQRANLLAPDLERTLAAARRQDFAVPQPPPSA